MMAFGYKFVFGILRQSPYQNATDIGLSYRGKGIRVNSVMAVDPALREVCALLFQEPHRVVQFQGHMRHSKAWTNPLHRHDDLVQLDLCDGFGGEFQQGERRIPVSGTMAFVMYPGVRHQCRLVPERRQARYFSLKLHVPPDMELVRERSLPEVARDLRDCGDLIEALCWPERKERTSRGGMTMRMAAAAQVLALWPRDADVGGAYPDAMDKDAHEVEQIERAVAFIENSAGGDAPLNVDAVAEHIGLSTRQLERRFLAVLAVNPRDLIEQRRLMHAEEALADYRRSATSIAEAMGFSSIHSFSRWFSRLTGKSPTQYRADSAEML